VAPAFHLYLPQIRMGHGAIVERARAAEDAGFEGIAFMDHLRPPLADEREMWEAMSIAGWVLARTSTLRVGHLVLCDAFRHPAVLARQVTSFDHASGGRFELGVGWGSVPLELQTFGVGLTTPRHRVGRLAESLEIMKRLWTGEPVHYDGAYFTLRGAQQRPTPNDPIQITIGGVGPRTLELVRRHADWWNVPAHDWGKAAELRGQVGEVRISMQQVVALLSDEHERDQVTSLVRRRFGDTPMGEHVLIGTATDLGERFMSLHRGGVDRFYVWFADFAPTATLENFSRVIDIVSSEAFRND
jgi:alkanesulfonate monooxygenase SsuD/methylene tetrahydromethanopterin reductase-like flavin-dependent oxidoreductase (luciferase family)